MSDRSQHLAKSPSSSTPRPSIDDLLGPSHGRFFASGYKTAQYKIQLSTRGGDLNAFRARLRLTLKGQWSQKGEVDQLPHVSTTDIINMSVAMNEQVFSRLCILPDQSVVIDELIITAPTKPVEGRDYADVALLRLLTSDDTQEVRKSSCLTSKCHLFGFNVTGKFSTAPNTSKPPINIGTPDRSFWLNGFKSAVHSIAEVQIDGHEATSSFTYDHPGWEYPGIDFTHRHTVTN